MGAALALTGNVNLYDGADSECRTAAPDITLKEDKDVPCLVAPETNRSRLEKKKKKDESSNSLFYQHLKSPGGRMRGNNGICATEALQGIADCRAQTHRNV